MKVLLSLVLASILISLPLCAQNASLSGRVSDSTGRPLAAAKLSFLRKATNQRFETESTGEGFFVSPPLLPGEYRAECTAPGFATWTLDPLVVEVGQNRSLAIELKPGAVTESISVVDVAPLLITNTADRSSVMENKFVLSVPLNVRNPLQLINFSPAVVQGSSGFGASGTNTTTNTLTNTFRINGGKATTTEVLIDGAANTTALSNQTGGIPQVDAIQEFRLLTTPYAPEYGRTSGGVVTFATRGGTSKLHFTAHNFLRNSALDANGFNANRARLPRQSLKRNQFGGTVGGPVWIPKIYDGRNKTFFFAAYEGLRERAAASFLGSVPTDLERRGDFSQSLDVNGLPLVMYDPRTTRLDPDRPAGTTRFLRSIFPGNVIPAAQINAVGRNQIAFYPTANVPGLGRSNINNFFSGTPSGNEQDRIDARVDHQLSEKHRLMFRWNSFRNLNDPPNVYGNVAGLNATSNRLPGLNAAVQHNWIISPSMIFEHHFSYAFSESKRTTPGLGFDPLTLGFAPNTVTGLREKAFPALTATRLSGMALGQIAVSSNRPEVYQYRGAITMLRGKHSIKAGADFRLLAGNANFIPPLDIRATSNFTGGPNPQAADLRSGHGAADFLLGAATVVATITPFEQFRRPYWAFFAQDEYKLTSKLTLTYGLRYSFELPFVEHKDQWTFLDLASASPLQPRVPSIPNLTGGVGFLNRDGLGRRTQLADWNNIDPRLGVAYQLNEKTVVRSGFGIFTHPGLNSIDASNGATASTVSFPTLADGVTPAFNLAQPFPNGPIQPSGSSLGLLTLVGQSIAAPLRTQKLSYSAHWSVDIQRQLPWNLLVNVGYAANSALGLPSRINMNQLRDAELAQGTALVATVNNPFAGVITDATSPLSRPTVQRGQLLRPYPHFQNVTASGVAVGHSTYHSMQLTVERRFANGFATLFAYTKSKTIDNVGEVGSAAGDVAGFMNNNCFACDRSLAFQHVPDVMRWSLRYDIPFGYGRKYFNRGWASKAFGGWATGIFWSWDNGFPIRVLAPNNSNSFGGGTNMRPNATGQSARLSTDRVFADGAAYFNRAAFSQPAAFTFGNVSRVLPDVRNPGLNNWDLLLEKRFTITERLGLDFRAEFFNSLNTPQYGGPGTNLQSADFGILFLRQVNAARQIQFGLRLSF
jgi:hypothetical protein